jgi:hypothetical protein
MIFLKKKKGIGIIIRVLITIIKNGKNGKNQRQLLA